MTSGSTALARHAPVAAAALDSVEAAVWADVATIDLLDLVALAARGRVAPRDGAPRPAGRERAAAVRHTRR